MVRAVTLTAELTQFSEKNFEQAALGEGFKSVEWKKLQPDPKVIEERGKKFWQELEDAQPYAELIASA